MRKSGFTLIELMIVIAIIAIIAAIAIPNLLDARKAANEASAIASLRAIHSAQGIYREQDKDGNGTLDFATNIAQLRDANLIDAQIGGGIKQGYLITHPSGPGSSYATFFKWSWGAGPEEPYESGDRGFFINETGVIRYTVQLDIGQTNHTDWPAIGK